MLTQFVGHKHCRNRGIHDGCRISWESVILCGGRLQKPQIGACVLTPPCEDEFFLRRKNCDIFFEKSDSLISTTNLIRPSNVCLNYDMMWPLVGNSFIICVMGRLAVADNFSMWLLTVPTHTLGTVGLEFRNGYLGAM